MVGVHGWAFYIAAYGTINFPGTGDGEFKRERNQQYLPAAGSIATGMHTLIHLFIS